MSGVPRPDAEPLDVWSYSFVALCREHGIAPPIATALEAQTNVALATRFALHLLRSHRWVRRRFPCALSAGSESRYLRWLCGRGARKFGITPAALANVRAVFAQRPGQRICEVYLRDPALQRIYPLALSPLGQRGFLQWLTTHGRDDQQIRDEEILWFLHEATETVSRGIGLTYLLNPHWQARFPQALTLRTLGERMLSRLREISQRR